MRRTLRLRLEGRLLRAELLGWSGPLWSGEIACDSPGALRQAIAQLIAEPTLPKRPTRLTIELGSPLLQVRMLQGLPPVGAAALRSLVATQAGRYFRRNGTPLVTAAAWPDRDARRKGLARAVAVEEPWVEAALAGADDAGVPVAAIRPGGDPAAARLELVSTAERHRRRRHEQVTIRRLAVAVAVLWVSLAVAAAIRFERERREIEREIVRLEPTAQALAEARRAVGNAAAMVDALESTDRTRGALLVRLGQMAAALPDSAYLTTLTLTVSGGGTMTGAARRAGPAIAGLEREDAVASPRLGGPVVRELVDGRAWERFSASFGSAAAR